MVKNVNAAVRWSIKQVEPPAKSLYTVFQKGSSYVAAGVSRGTAFFSQLSRGGISVRVTEASASKSQTGDGVSKGNEKRFWGIWRRPQIYSQRIKEANFQCGNLICDSDNFQPLNEFLSDMK